MTTIKINHRNHTIEISKTFETKASRYGSNEYNMLQNARRDNPNYRVVITKRRKTSKSGSETSPNRAIKGLSFEYMERYIEAHDEEKTILMEYYRRRGDASKNPEALPASESYKDIKNWFFNQYPALAKSCGIDLTKSNESIA